MTFLPTDQFAAAHLDGGGAVFNVKHPDFGAVGDGPTDDHAAITAAITAAIADSSTGAVVLLPPGTYGVSEDIIVPHGLALVGSGQRCTIIKALSGATFTDAVVSSRPDPAAFFVGTRVAFLQVNGNDIADRGILVEAWNEGSELDNVHVQRCNVEGVRMQGVAATTFFTQNTSVRSLRITTLDVDNLADALVLSDVRHCLFFGLSFDQASTAAGPFRTGIRMLERSYNNVFIRTWLEDCGLPIRMGEDGDCPNNQFVELGIRNTHFQPESRTVGSFTGTMAITQEDVSAAPQLMVRGLITDDFDYDLVDAATDRAIVGASTGPSRFINRIELLVDAAGNPVWNTDQQHSLARVATGSLPAAAAGMDGVVLIEDAGSGDQNLVVYSDGQRFRIDGGTAF